MASIVAGPVFNRGSCTDRATNSAAKSLDNDGERQTVSAPSLGHQPGMLGATANL